MSRRAPFLIEPLARRHEGAVFGCGVPALDRYLVYDAALDVARRIVECFVAVETVNGRIAGFYTLAPLRLLLSGPRADSGGDPPLGASAPAVLLERLAVARVFQGMKLGAVLLADAVERAASSEDRVCGVLAEARDERARSFYAHHGFVALADHPRRLLLPVAAHPPLPGPAHRADGELAPAHVGGFLKRSVLPEGMPPAEAARRLGIEESGLRRLFEERVPLSPELALRFEQAFGVKMETLLRMQVRYEAWRIRKASNVVRGGVSCDPINGASRDRPSADRY